MEGTDLAEIEQRPNKYIKLYYASTTNISVKLQY